MRLQLFIELLVAVDLGLLVSSGDSIITGTLPTLELPSYPLHSPFNSPILFDYFIILLPLIYLLDISSRLLFIAYGDRKPSRG